MELDTQLGAGVSGARRFHRDASRPRLRLQFEIGAERVRRSSRMAPTSVLNDVYAVGTVKLVEKKPLILRERIIRIPKRFFRFILHLRFNGNVRD